MRRCFFFFKNYGLELGWGLEPSYTRIAAKSDKKSQCFQHGYTPEHGTKLLGQKATHFSTSLVRATGNNHFIDSGLGFEGKVYMVKVNFQ